MRSRFDADMAQLHKKMIAMGALCECGIANAIKALLEKTDENARQTLEIEQEVNCCEREIERLCYTLLLRQQPVAKDLRTISACLKMITDLERINDQAADIAEIALIKNQYSPEGKEIIKKMSIECIGMVTDSIDAFVRQDAKLAKKVIQNDDIVDEYFNTARTWLVQELSSNTEDAAWLLDLLMVAKYLERIADHAVNIAEWVNFIETAKH